ncbi:SWIM zinc finger family protein [Actinocorallia populi]|uniref:SWIM zinc finger family protein n=1 Tax=Actinocorallia populi TaxID=2079200 RepID=UPI001E4C05FD|nr:hypothetical protein [Actinocorallia populi]
MGGDYFAAARPLRVRGGPGSALLREPPGRWARRFVGALESFLDVERLHRGRASAERGQVLRLDVRPYEVTAFVANAADEPYEVTLGLTAIEGWEEIEGELARRAVFRARLLAGELPPDVERVFADCGVGLFPEAAEELHLMCGCADWIDPCLHAAAALHFLARAFDDDPFLVLAWNGRTRDELLTALRRRPVESELPPVVESPLRAADFWAPPDGLAALKDRTGHPPAPPGLLLRLLDPPAVKIRRRALVDVLEPAYRALAGGDGEPPE